MTKKEQETQKEDELAQIIETVDENGKVVKFELFDIVEVDEKEYALLLPVAEDEESKEAEGIEDDEVVLMRLSKDGDEYVFEVIEDDDEFKKVSEYIETMDDEDEEEV